MRVTLLLAAVLFCSAILYGQEPSDSPVANPGRRRPTVSTPATITPVGYLQFETGTLDATDSPEFSSRTSVNEVLKFSVSHRFEFFAASEPFVHHRANEKTGNGTAEVFLRLQGVVHHREAANLKVAMSYVQRIDDGGVPEFDVSSARNSCLLLASADVKGFHYDANAMFNEVIQAGTHRAQFGQSFPISHPVNKKVEYPVRYGISLSRSCEAMPSIISGRSARYAHPASALLN